MDSSHHLLKKMEFGGFKARFEEATAKAVSAAKNFQSLDQMAQDDEYIRSEGLKVKRKTSTSRNVHNGQEDDTLSSDGKFNSKKEEVTVSLYPEDDPIDHQTYEPNNAYDSPYSTHQNAHAINSSEQENALTSNISKPSTLKSNWTAENVYDSPFTTNQHAHTIDSSEQENALTLNIFKSNTSKSNWNADNVYGSPYTIDSSEQESASASNASTSNTLKSNRTADNVYDSPYSTNQRTHTIESSEQQQENTPILSWTETSSLPLNYSYMHESVKSLITDEFDYTDSRSDRALSRDVERQSTAQRHLNSDDGYASSSSSVNDGITSVLNRSNRSRRTAIDLYEQEDTLTVTKRITTSNATASEDDSDLEQPEKKDPNRFFADLDARLETIPLVRTESSPKEKPPRNGGGSLPNLLEAIRIPGVGGARQNGMNWLRSVVPPKIQKSIQKILVEQPLPSESNDDRVHEDFGMEMKGIARNINSGDGCGSEVIDVVTSTAIFGKDESMELERLERRMKKGYLRSVLDSLLGNRYLVYIFIPFLLTTLAYFMTRKKTDDSVT